MVIWAYMLQCADRHFYDGHTDDLKQRLGKDQARHFKGYMATRMPAHLAWSEQSPSREGAKAAEARLKGWSRGKKLALIRGGWASIAQLALSKTGQRQS